MRFIRHPELASELDKIRENTFWWNHWDVTKRSIRVPLHLFEPKTQRNSDIHYYTGWQGMSNTTIISKLMTLSMGQVINELAWLAHDAEIHYADVEYMNELIPMYNCAYMVIFFWNTNFFKVDWIDRYMRDFRFVRAVPFSERV